MAGNIQIAVDDFGISALTNERILALAGERRVDRVAVMVYGSISADEVSALLASGVALDIHLDIREGIDPNRKLSGDVLGRGVKFLTRYFLGRYSKRSISSMWEQQIQKFEEIFGRLPDGLNTHEHIHFFPPFFRVLTDLANRYAISYVRSGKRASGTSHGVARILDILRLSNRRALRKMKCKTSDVLVSADWLPGFDIEYVRRSLRPNESAEVIFHLEREGEYEYLVTSVPRDA